MSRRNILFDLDGTLIDSAPSILSGFARVLQQHGIKPICELSQALIGPPLIETLERVSGINDPVLLGMLANDFQLQYDETAFKESRAYPGIPEVLEELAAGGASLYVVTNKRIVPSRKIVKYLGWNNFFKGIYSLDAFEPMLSTKAQVIARVTMLHQIENRSATYVGDREEDRDAATKSGIGFIAVNWGYAAWNESEGIVLAENPHAIQELLN